MRVDGGVMRVDVPLEPGGKKVQVSVRLEEWQIERLAKIAALKKRSFNAVIRYVIDKGLEAIRDEIKNGP
jgi:hypothetical protein